MQHASWIFAHAIFYFFFDFLDFLDAFKLLIGSIFNDFHTLALIKSLQNGVKSKVSIYRVSNFRAN